MVREYEKNPDLWTNFVTSLEGTVTSIHENPQGCMVQLWVEKQKNIVVYWPMERMPGVVEGTYLNVLGNVLGRTSGTNAFGGTVTAVTVQCFGYVADRYRVTPIKNFLPSKKDLFEKMGGRKPIRGRGPRTGQKIEDYVWHLRVDTVNAFLYFWFVRPFRAPKLSLRAKNGICGPDLRPHLRNTGR
jgi:hypothetical protein